MSRILFLDDCPTRRARFGRHFPEATLVETADECIAQLRDHGPWDEVFLDHDLGGETYVDPSLPNTGSAVVRWIAENQDEVDRWTGFTIHSLNAPAANAMVADLADLGYRARYVNFLRLVDTVLR